MVRLEKWGVPCRSGRSRCLIGLHLSKQSTDTLQILCLGAHSDDIEIGCGGTLLHLKQLFPRLKFHWIVFSAAGPRAQEAAKAAELFTAGCEKEIPKLKFIPLSMSAGT